MRLALVVAVLFVIGVAPGIAHHGHSWPVVQPPRIAAVAPAHAAQKHKAAVRFAVIWKKLATRGLRSEQHQLWREMGASPYGNSGTLSAFSRT